MIGRGAVGNPWIFYQLKYGKSMLDDALKAKIILEHYDSMIEFYGSRGVSMFRKHLHVYSKGFNEASVFRDTINHIGDEQEARVLIKEFFMGI